MIENFEFYQKDEGFNMNSFLNIREQETTKYKNISSELIKYRERKLNMTEEH